jgi:hypothetical protein
MLQRFSFRMQEENANADAASAGIRFWQWVEVNEERT